MGRGRVRSSKFLSLKNDLKLPQFALKFEIFFKPSRFVPILIKCCEKKKIKSKSKNSKLTCPRLPVSIYYEFLRDIFCVFGKSCRTGRGRDGNESIFYRTRQDCSTILSVSTHLALICLIMRPSNIVQTFFVVCLSYFSLAALPSLERNQRLKVQGSLFCPSDPTRATRVHVVLYDKDACKYMVACLSIIVVNIHSNYLCFH